MSSGPAICKLEFNGPTASPACRREFAPLADNQKHFSRHRDERRSGLQRLWKLDYLFFIPLLTLPIPPIPCHWNKPSGTGGSSQERKLTGFTFTPPVTGELVGC